MSRKSKIRWRDSDVQELQRIINNYNNKLYRLKKNHPEMVEYLPQRMTKTQAIDSIETRADFNRLTKSLQRFSKRGAEAPVTSSRGAKATQWEVDEFNRMQRIDNARKTRERKALEAKEVKIAGQGQGKTRAEMGSIRQNELKNANHKFSSKSQKEWDLAKRALEQRMKQNYTDKSKRYMQANYIRGLMNAGFSDELIKYMSTIDPDKFFEIIETDETATFDFIYDPIELKVKEDKLWETWEEHGTGRNQLGVTMEELEQFNYWIDNNVSDEMRSSMSFKELFVKYFNL